MDTRLEWENYVVKEREMVTPLLFSLGFVLDADQPHLKGERYLMQAVTTSSGKKLILLGQQKNDSKRVVIKASRDPNGIREIVHERTCRDTLQKMLFAYSVFHSPREILFLRKGGFVISIQEFIEQERAFTDRPIKEQFMFALKSFEAQEGAHASTYEHMRSIKRTIGHMNAHEYIRAFKSFSKNLLHQIGDTENEMLLAQALSTLESKILFIEQYGGFLTHTDFVPHNFRISKDTLYLLDYSSIRFGNKYEGWARFLNYMTLHNGELAKLLINYVRDNRSEEESVTLRLMRIYRLGEIIWYYVNTIDNSEGNLKKLNKLRVNFWMTVLRSVLNDTDVPAGTVLEYEHARDFLRSDDEKERQKKLH